MAKFYRGVTPGNNSFQEIFVPSQDSLAKMETMGRLRSFTSVLSASRVTIPIGVFQTSSAGGAINSSGDWTNQSANIYSLLLRGLNLYMLQVTKI